MDASNSEREPLSDRERAAAGKKAQEMSKERNAKEKGQEELKERQLKDDFKMAKARRGKVEKSEQRESRKEAKKRLKLRNETTKADIDALKRTAVEYDPKTRLYSDLDYKVHTLDSAKLKLTSQGYDHNMGYCILYIERNEGSEAVRIRGLRHPERVDFTSDSSEVARCDAWYSLVYSNGDRDMCFAIPPSVNTSLPPIVSDSEWCDILESSRGYYSNNVHDALRSLIAELAHLVPLYSDEDVDMERMDRAEGVVERDFTCRQQLVDKLYEIGLPASEYGNLGYSEPLIDWCASSFRTYKEEDVNSLKQGFIDILYLAFLAGKEAQREDILGGNKRKLIQGEVVVDAQDKKLRTNHTQVIHSVIAAYRTAYDKDPTPKPFKAYIVSSGNEEWELALKKMSTNALQKFLRKSKEVGA